MKAIYTAVLTPKEHGGYFCRIPDLPGCLTSGKDLADALTNAQDAANVWMLESEDEGKECAPIATPQNQVSREDGDICALVQVDTEAYRRAIDTRAVRKNVSLPAWMAKRAEASGINCSQVLQDALRSMLR